MKFLALAPVAAAIVVLSPAVRADAVTDWNQRVDALITEARLGTPPAVRVVALVQTAVLEAVGSGSARGAELDAAVAAANRGVLAKLLPAQQPAIDTAYQAAIAALPENAARAAGIAAGERAAAAVLARRADDGAATPESLRPHTTPGAWVPTAAAAAPHWGQRKPWLIASPAQFRPAPPPALQSAAWVRDYQEVQSLGARQSKQRSAEQTDVARFWEYSLPSIYHGVLQSAAAQPGRDPVRNARLFAAAAQAMDDALIAVFEAKYHYGFWRPVTAIRNGDADGHDATVRDAGWVSLIDAPLHPEYPSGHSILASAVATVVQADLGRGPAPVFETRSPSAKGAARRWTRLEDFVQEVSDARIWAGIHFRSATEAGVAMGRRIGAIAAERLIAEP